MRKRMTQFASYKLGWNIMKVQETPPEQAFLDIYDRHADAVFRHCYFRVYDRELAKEFMQEAFTKAWQYVAEGKKVGNMKALVYKIANNLIIDYTRKKKESSLEALTAAGFQPETREAPCGEQVDGTLVLAKFEFLDEEYRQVVYWRYIDNLTPKEIAEMTGESANVISVRIHRGVKKLRTLVKYGHA